MTAAAVAHNPYDRPFRRRAGFQARRGSRGSPDPAESRLPLGAGLPTPPKAAYPRPRARRGSPDPAESRLPTSPLGAGLPTPPKAALPTSPLGAGLPTPPKAAYPRPRAARVSRPRRKPPTHVLQRKRVAPGRVFSENVAIEGLSRPSSNTTTRKSYDETIAQFRHVGS